MDCPETRHIEAHARAFIATTKTLDTGAQPAGLVLDFTPSPDSQAFRDIEQVAKLTAEWPASLRDRLFKTITANVCARLDRTEDGRIQWLLYVAEPVHSGLLQCVEQLPKTHPHLFTQTQAAGPAPQPVSPASADPSTSRRTEPPAGEKPPGTSTAASLESEPRPRHTEAADGSCGETDSPSIHCGS